VADQKISELDPVTTVDDTDAFVLARAGESKKITGANLKAAGATTTVVPLTAIDLATLQSSPVELVAPPGSGFALVLISCTAIFTNGSTVYDFAGSTDAFINYVTVEETSIARCGTIDTTLNAAFPGVLGFTPLNGGSTDAENAGLEIVATDDPSQGDGTLLVAVTYTTVEV